ncbi:hypothetical protein DSL92_03070 [Billgrantia gudaonensis]|uniref:Uncharacterized protein n=1 Tax=Billgrantia gudaonensis TaxID=376427 RepID=A0A432JK10_9GAMM|nr:hypothetical protein DSL92_03070 [Halomonas gudaonensis]
MLAGVADGVQVLAVGSERHTLRVHDWQALPEGQLALVATPEGSFPWSFRCWAASLSTTCCWPWPRCTLA